MKAKYLVIIGLLAVTFAACSRDEESLFEKPAAIRAQEAIENAFNVLTAPANGWEMAYFPNLEASAKGYNMVLKFNKNGNVSVTAKNATTTANKIVTDTASTWAVKSDYGPILTFDTYNDVFHAFSDPGNDGAGLLGDYEFLILKATPELVLLKGKKHSAYTVMRPMKNTDLAAYYAACEKMQADLFGNNNIVTLIQGDSKMYLYKGAEGQFQSAAYGSPLIAEAATYHPVCSTEDGIIVSTGFGEDVHDHIFYYDAAKGELRSEKGAVMNAGNLNVLFGAYFTDNAYGWSVDPAGQPAVDSLLAAVNTAMKNTSAKMKVMGYGYKQSLNMYEGGYFMLINFSYKQGSKTQEKKLVWEINLEQNENGITIKGTGENGELVPYDEGTEKFLIQIPSAQAVAELMLGEFSAAPLEGNLFNAVAGMLLMGEKQLTIKGANNVKM
ncbi:MAG: DUF4302 domain-containing protein [Paludibacteraceae bacterium]|nr:DUF4302 domain-containing protein [Paludibacteraceae bacterium]